MGSWSMARLGLRLGRERDMSETGFVVQPEGCTPTVAVL